MNGISVIIPVYNTKKHYLDKCIDSLICNNFNRIEILIIDDNSNIECINHLKDLVKKDVRIKLIHLDKNMGVSNARNVGIENASYKWIMFVDADDWVEGNIFEVLFGITEEVDFDILLFNCFIHYKEQRFKNKFLKFSDGPINNQDLLDIKLQIFNKKSAFYFPRYNCVGVSWAKLYKKDYLIKNKFLFEEKLRRAEDHVFFLHILNENPNLFYINDYLYNYRKNNNSTVNKWNENVKEDFINTLIELKKILNNSSNKKLENAYNLRCINYLLATLSNDYFHKDNKKEFDIKKNELNQLLDLNIFMDAVKKSSDNLSNKDRIRLFLLLRKKYKILNLIYKINILVKVIR